MRRLQLLLVVALSLTMMGNAHGDVCSQNMKNPDHVNGCSIPGGVPFPYAEFFTPACNHHDICYRCGGSYGVSRATCDETFHNDMLTLCQSSRRRREIFRRHNVRVKRFMCKTAAYVYYNGVRVGGSSRYHSKDNPKPFCPESWVSSCLPAPDAV